MRVKSYLSFFVAVSLVCAQTPSSRRIIVRPGDDFGFAAMSLSSVEKQLDKDLDDLSHPAQRP
jgi:hypothetical protein